MMALLQPAPAAGERSPLLGTEGGQVVLLMTGPPLEMGLQEQSPQLPGTRFDVGLSLFMRHGECFGAGEAGGQGSEGRKHAGKGVSRRGRFIRCVHRALVFGQWRSGWHHRR